MLHLINTVKVLLKMIIELKFESPITNIVVYDLEAFKKFELFLIVVVFIY